MEPSAVFESDFHRLREERDALERQLAEARAALPPQVFAAPPVVITPPPTFIKLDLGCGEHPREGFEGVDAYAPSAKHRIDLLKFPWPWADSSVEELHCSHFAEHIPACYVQPDGSYTLVQGADGVDLFFAFFNECWRILKRDAAMLVVTPALQSVRAFQDPTHRRFIAPQTLLYLNAEWRRLNGLDHYLGAVCNFGVNSLPTVPKELTLLSPEAQQRRFQESWNTVVDWHTTLKVIKP